MTIVQKMQGWLARAINGRHVLMLLLFSVGYYASYFNYGLDLDDEGFLLANASSILIGQWPMADFFSYQPLSYFVLAAVLQLFGDTVYSERLLLVVLLLVNIWLIYYVAIRILPLNWAWLPAAIYAFAPGPWYKVFFISHMLLSLAAVVYFIEKPNLRKVFVLGLTCGLALISRIHSGELILVISIIVIAVLAFKGQERPAGLFPQFVWLLRQTVAFLGGAGLVVFLMFVAYWMYGKLPSLLENISRYYDPTTITRFLTALSGRGAAFDFQKLFQPHAIEMWVYAIAMLVCILNLLRYGKALISSPSAQAPTMIGFAIALFGIGSMGYTYFFVWNSRMLSSFAIVYVNFFMLLSSTHLYVTSHGRYARFGKPILWVGFLLIAIYLHSFTKVQNYSGSITTRTKGMVQMEHARLHGIYVYPGQDETIRRLSELTSGANPGDNLIPMSEATTLGYLSGLPNQTYYRLFLSEFAPQGEEARAIEEFDRLKVRYFVARRHQFLDGPMIGSDLKRYAPKIRAYLIENYSVTELGPGFVLLERRAQ